MHGGSSQINFCAAAESRSIATLSRSRVVRMTGSFMARKHRYVDGKRLQRLNHDGLLNRPCIGSG